MITPANYDNCQARAAGFDKREVRSLSARRRDGDRLDLLFSTPVENSFYGGCIMESTIPTDLLEIKGRFETWRTNRKYMREPIPNELWDRVPFSVSVEGISVDVEDSESDSPPAPGADDEFTSLRLSDRGPNSNRLRRESEAFFC
jgi:hypothetical protein